MDPFYHLRRPSPSPLFLIPAELRILIYELVFTSAPPSADRLALPWSSVDLEPLLTCRDFYTEARLIAFACVTHNLNWRRPSSATRRLRWLQPILHAHIRHVALVSSPQGLYERLLPLRRHFDHSLQPFIYLESLTIVLDAPDTSTDLARKRRVQDQKMLFASIWYFKNVNRVVLVNVLHKEDMREGSIQRGKWTCIDDEKPLPTVFNSPLADTRLVDKARWRFEMTTFYDYVWKPWHR